MEKRTYNMQALRAIGDAIDNAPAFSPFDAPEVSRKNALEFLRPKIVVLYTKGYDTKMIADFLRTNGSPFVPSKNQIDLIISNYEDEKKKRATQRAEKQKKKEVQTLDTERITQGEEDLTL